MALIYLGKSHRSSQVHEMVIRHLENAGPTARRLEALRATAGPSRDALYAGDFVALGQAMIQNTEAQRNLHPALVSPNAQRVIEIAQAHGALGWKVNGAGGALTILCGSLTILCGLLSHAKRAMIREIEEGSPPLSKHRNVPIHLSRFGLRTWEMECPVGRGSP